MQNETISFLDFELNLKKLLNNKSFIVNNDSKLFKELDAIFNYLPSAANIFDHKELRHTYCNENLCSLMGYSRKQFMGENGMQTVYDTFRPELR